MGRMKNVFKKRKGGFNYKAKPTDNRNISPTPSTSTQPIVNNDVPLISTSKEKLHTSIETYDSFSSNSEYIIVDFSEMFSHFQSVAACKICQHGLSYKKQQIIGLAAKITIFCPSCEANTTEFFNCKQTVVEKDENIKTFFDLNLRLVESFRSIGKGRTSAKVVCGLMNISPPPDSYREHEIQLCNVMQNLSNESMKKAVEEVVDKSESRDICVAVDGSWQKRGHTSLNGVVTVTSVDTGKVLDVSIMSKHCLCPEKSQNIHCDECTANYSGTSGGMEVAGALQLFHRSQELYNVRYMNYLGDGDSAAFQTVANSLPYGDDHIQKLECVGHVQKRMGSRLRTLKALHKAQKKKLSDGKPIGGKNRLTDSAIQKLQLYYGLAIRRNTSSVAAMRKAIWAEFYHVRSSNEDPLHQLCDDSWCKYKEAQGTRKEYDHSQHFHIQKIIMDEMKPIFKSLTESCLLEKCLSGKTQNVNESLNNLIWSIIPKRTFVTLKTLQYGIYNAVLKFNDGNMSKILAFKSMNLDPGRNTLEAMKKLDEARVKDSERAIQEIEKKIRQKRSLSRRRLEDEYEQQESQAGPSYSSGQH
jgi:hypothetical protein